MTAEEDSVPDMVTRITFNLSPSAKRALASSMLHDETDNKTETLIRAIKTYAWLRETVADGGALYMEKANGKLERIRFL